MRQPHLPAVLILSILSLAAALPQPYPPPSDLAPAIHLTNASSPATLSDERRAWQRSLVRRQLFPAPVAAATTPAAQAAAAAAARSAAAQSAAQAQASARAAAAAEAAAESRAAARAVPTTTTVAHVNAKATVALAATSATTELPVSSARGRATTPEPSTAAESSTGDVPSSRVPSVSSESSTVGEPSTSSAGPSSLTSSPASSPSATSAHSTLHSSASASSTASAAYKAKSGSIFSPSNKLFALGVFVIIGIIFIAILAALFIVKRAAHHPRFADARDYPSDLLPPLAASGRGEKKRARFGAGQEDGCDDGQGQGRASLLRDAQPPAGAADAVREWNAQRRVQIPASPMMTMVSAPARPPLGRLSSRVVEHSAAGPPPPPPPAKTAAPPPPPRPSTSPLPGAAPRTGPHKLSRARTQRADVDELARHRYSPPRGRESALRHELRL